MWEAIFDIIFYMWLGRVVIGAVWGIAKFRATFYDVSHWDWRDAFIAGPAFWIGWAIGTGLRHLAQWLRKKWYERASWEWSKKADADAKNEIDAALKKDGVELIDIEDVQE